MNGDFILTVKYPISDTGIYKRIKEDMLIKCPTPVLGPQLFRIKKPVENNDQLEITAYHITDDIMQRSVKPVQVTNQTCSIALSQMVQNAKTDLGDFSFTSDIQDRRTFNMTETENIYSVLMDGKHSIVGTWEGELVRDNFSLLVKKNRGENRGVVITTHKNLKSYQRSKNSQNVITRIHARSTFKPEGTEHETTIKVTVDSPLINSYPYINEKEYENNNLKTVEDLKKWAQAKFTNEGIDKVSDSIKLEAYELDGQVVHLGDTVNLKSLKHNVDIFKKAIAYEYDGLKEEYISLEFDDKPGFGGSGVSNGLSNVASTIIGATYSAQEIAIERAARNANLAFEHQSNQLKKEVEDGIELIKAKAEENKRSLSEEINRRFKDFSPAGFEEAKAKAEEALKKAGTSAEVISEIKEVIRGNSIDLINISSRVNEQDDKITDFKNEYGSKMLEVTQTTDSIKTKIGEITSFIDKDGQRQEELKRYAREETASKTNAIRETISKDYVAKSTYLENVEGINQRFEALKRDNEVKIADYKQGIEGRFTSLASQIAGKVNEADFQRVKETSQLYERVLGNTEQGLPDKISRLVMTNEIFQTEVNDLVVSDNNLIVNSETLDKHTIVNKRSGVDIYTTSAGVFNIDAQGLTGYNWGGFTLPIYVPKILKGEVYTLGFKYKIRRQLDHEFCVAIKNHSQNKTVLQKTIATPETPVRNVWIDFQSTFKMTEDLDFDQVGNFPIYLYLVKNGWIEVKEPMLVRGPRTGSFKPSQFDEAYKMTDEAKGLATDAQTRAIQIAKGLEATRTQVTQLAGSWAVQNLNSAGDIISGINLGANGNNRIIGRATHITGDTLIDNAVIKSAMVDKLKTANFEAGSVTTNILEAEAVTADKVKFDTAFIQKLVSKQAFIDELFAKQATITRIQSIDFTANHIKGGMLTSTNGRSVFDLNSGQIRMQSGSTGWRTSWDSNGIAFRGPGDDVWGAMGGDSGGGVGIYMRGDHAFNLVVNHNDDGKSQPYTPLRVKYGDGTYLQFSPGGPSYNLLTLFKTIFDNFKYNNRTYYDIR
nr:MAG TPA: Neck appendage protein [Caudoviricetes sp.]